MDTSSRFGQPDNDGWYYGVSFDRLNESLRNGNAAGTTNATSIVRKRRWARNMVCISPEVMDNMKKRIEEIQQYRCNIEIALQDKESAFKAITFYEENRSFVFAQSLNLATNGTVTTLSFLRELINKLKVIKQVSLYKIFSLYLMLL